ncbi:hypothetical protein ACS386_06355 [Flavobacteriaceae bacterium LMO-SS05]
MIKLFRNIRKDLLNKGKTTNLTSEKSSVGTYLKYAMDEIIKCPIRDCISVTNNRIVNQHAYRYAI